MRRIDYIIIHHWGSPKATLQSIKSRHEELGFEDSLGYHYIVGNGAGVRDGEVIEGRSVEKGATQSRGVNSKAIGILAIGNFDIYFPSKLEWQATVELVKRLMYKYEIPADNILGHREIPCLFGREAERSCPGFKWDMDRFRKECFFGGTELFSDGGRHRSDLTVSYDGVLVPDVEPQSSGTKVMVNVTDIERIFDVNVEFHPKLRQVAITTRQNTGG